MFKFMSAGQTRSDCTTPYNIKLDKEYTVKDFIETVLENKPDEWGYIGIKNIDEPLFGSPRIEYKYGKIVKRCSMDDMPLNAKIIKADADGGWSNMDYQLEVEMED